MATVSNSSPLILFDGIGRIDLLRSVFGELLIPPSVQHEIAVVGFGRPGAAVVAAADWIQIRQPGDGGRDPALSDLGPGEREALMLALDLGRDTAILLDDLGARRYAQRHGLHFIGSGGILVLAKERGLIRAVAPLLQSMRDSGLYLDERTYGAILGLAGEEEEQ